MTGPLDRLCQAFEDELERQENVLRLCQLQEEAALARDAALLAERARALSLLIDETARAEAARIAVTREAVEALALPPQQQTLSGLVAAAPEPWRARLADAQQRLRAVMLASAETVRRSDRVMRRLLQGANTTLELLIGADRAGLGGYTMAGGRAAGHAPGARLINQAG